MQCMSKHADRCREPHACCSAGVNIPRPRVAQAVRALHRGPRVRSRGSGGLFYITQVMRSAGARRDRTQRTCVHHARPSPALCVRVAAQRSIDHLARSPHNRRYVNESERVLRSAMSAAPAARVLAVHAGCAAIPGRAVH